MDPIEAPIAESDPRFPSGPWTGFFLQWWMPGRHMMDIETAFSSGRFQATGQDIVGPFTLEGSYNATDGKCKWVKSYQGKHSVKYEGVNEGEGIWGVWEIKLGPLYRDQGVVHIWPRGMKPTEAANATVSTYLAQVRSRGLIRLFKFVVGLGLLFAAMYLMGRLSSLLPGVGFRTR